MMSLERPPGPARALYRDPVHYDLLAQMTAPPDLAFYRMQIGDAGGALLELGCGTGRLTRPLSGRVDATVGLDNAAEMLAFARARADAQACRADFVEGDFRDFTLGRRFDWILLPYNALNHALSADDIAGLFDCVRSHLAAGGRFIVDTFHPDPAALGRAPERRRILTYRDPLSGDTVVMYEENRYDAARQVNRVHWSYDVGERQEALSHVVEMRVFFPEELLALFACHGLKIDSRFGDYDQSPFGGKSPKQLVVARLA